MPAISFTTRSSFALSSEKEKRRLPTEPFDIGKSCFDNGDFDSAIRHLTEAIRLAPTNFFAYGYRGCAYGKKGVFDKAIADFTEAILLDPKNALVYYRRGMVYKKRRERSKAEADFAQAKKLGLLPEDEWGH